LFNPISDTKRNSRFKWYWFWI